MVKEKETMINNKTLHTKLTIDTNPYPSRAPEFIPYMWSRKYLPFQST
jgi:hypothetical protein